MVIYLTFMLYQALSFQQGLRTICNNIQTLADYMPICHNHSYYLLPCNKIPHRNARAATTAIFQLTCKPLGL